jgi:hypothetical protein
VSCITVKNVVKIEFPRLIVVRALLEAHQDGEPFAFEISRDEARELYDALHPLFGDFDQARELSHLARESVDRELKLAAIEAEVLALRGLMAGTTMAIPFTEQVNETGPTLNDDIEAMIASRGEEPDSRPAGDLHGSIVQACAPHEADAATEPEPEPAEQPRRPGRQRQYKTDEDKAVAKWHQLRESYPWETHSKTLTRITWAFNPRPKVDAIREWIRAAGIKVEDAPTQDEILVQARAVKNGAPIKQPPFGYVVADVEMWNASAGLMSDSDIRELAEGGLARCGLRKVAA